MRAGPAGECGVAGSAHARAPVIGPSLRPLLSSSPPPSLAEDDIEGIVGRRVQHAVVREAGVVHDVVNLAVLPTGTSADALGSLDVGRERARWKRT